MAVRCGVRSSRNRLRASDISLQATAGLAPRAPGPCRDIADAERRTDVIALVILPMNIAFLDQARASNCTGEDLHGYTDQPPTT
jgi:hypothetical protein